MAERSSVKKTKTRPSSQRSKTELQTKSVTQEQQYKLMNAELEAKTAELVKEAEQLMREQNEVLSTPLSSLLLTDFEHEEDPRSSKVSGEDSAHFFVSTMIRNIEEKMNDDHDVCNTGDNEASGSEAQTRVFRAKIRILQEELDQLTSEYYKKDDENTKLRAKVKDLEEDGSRSQKTMNCQQTQMEKLKALVQESAKKSEALQTQVSALNKEIEHLNRSNKQTASAHNSMEVRLNRALDQLEKTKTTVSKITHINKDKMKEENQIKEKVLSENRILKKQKSDLILGFKKQLRLIDLLKRQKMHFEAAKMLSFTEDEFMKALDWSSS